MNKRLDFGNLELQGRTEEFNVLCDAYLRVKNTETPSSEIVLVRGYSGTGKSSLIRKLRTWMLETQNENGYFVSGKFDQQRTAEPYYALAVAFNELCDLIVEGDAREKIMAAFVEEVGLKAKVLLDVVPNMKQLIGDDFARDDGRRESTSTSLNQLKFVFRAFVRSACAAIVQPIVLFLDDLQWADEASLELITSLVTDSDSTHFLFLGSYRDNEISENHPFTRHLKIIESGNHMSLVHLGNFDIISVNQLIAILTQLNPIKTEPLAEIVHHKTNGNIFFVLQFLRMLQGNNLLFFSFQTFEWTWDLDKIKAQTDLTDNVVDLVSKKIERMSTKTCAALKLASCLWSTFDIGLVQDMLLKGNAIAEREGLSSDLASCLDEAADEGLLDKLSDTRYKFSHDRIRQAAYELIPKGREREEFHHWIGGMLWEMAESSQSEEWMYFAAADQMNRASALVEKEEIRVELAKLNLLVAEKAIALSAFVPALGYLKAGLILLPKETRWQDYYDLTLKLSNQLLDMEHCCGRCEETQKVADEIFSHAVCSQDKVEAQFTMGLSLVSQTRQPEAAELCFSVLESLGERLPKRVSRIALSVECSRLSRALRDMSDEDILDLPPMKEDFKIAAARFYDLMYNCKFHVGLIRYASLLAVRMTRLTLRYGICDESPFFFSFWGQVMIAEGDIRGGYRFGKLALKLADRVNTRNVKARTATIVSTFLSHWREPLQNSLQPLLDAHRSAMLGGDITWSSHCILGYQTMYFYSGLPLGTAVEDMLAFSRQMKEYNQELFQRAQPPVLQTMLNLMGRSKHDVLTLTGDAMNQKEYEDQLANPLGLGLQTIASCRMQLAYYFDDLELAEELSKKLQINAKNETYVASYYTCVRTMFFGLISIALARRTKKRKHSSKARKIIADIKEKWVRRGAVNVLHKLYLLEAEYATLNNASKTDNVREAFDSAVSAARRSGFIQDEALANERAGIFFLERGDKFWASSYLSRAHELYIEWGAQAKADDLEKNHGLTVMTTHEEQHVSHLRGRQHFSDEPTKCHKALDSNHLFHNA